MSESDDGIPELTDAERIRIQATESDFTRHGRRAAQRHCHTRGR